MTGNPRLKQLLHPRRKYTKSGFDVSLYQHMKREADDYVKANGRPLSKMEKRVYYLTGKLPP